MMLLTSSSRCDCRPHFVKSNRSRVLTAEGNLVLYWCVTGRPRGHSEAHPPPLPAWELVSRQKQQPAPAGGPAATDDGGGEARRKCRDEAGWVQPVCEPEHFTDSSS